ncbi:pectate lyase-like adhesive domain-containing protein [Enterococcus sp. AZ173]|uniref:pectate lyase-like adhesive domain-containing protein n=1 Tax=Enterococcus sp. AZ173 TaxID=2774700 RepID=UPI003D2AE713
MKKTVVILLLVIGLSQSSSLITNARETVSDSALSEIEASAESSKEEESYSETTPVPILETTTEQTSHEEANTSQSAEDATLSTQGSTEEPVFFAEDEINETAEIGTQENPHLVSSYSELQTALVAAQDAGETNYIQLQNDIIYNGEVRIGQNTVIDGNGYAILYSGTSYGVAHFRTNANNITITYKNLTFGNSSYPNSTYYGILYIGHSNIHFIVENITYTIQNGGQPFWGNNDAGNTLELRGENQFYSSGSTYGGEFVEGYRNVVFAEASHTTIYNDTPTATALFWSTAQTVTLAKRAVVSIESSKPLLFYGDNATLNIQEEASFYFKKFYGTNYQTNDISLSSIGILTGNLAENAIAYFTTEANGFSGNDPLFNLTSPDRLVFEAVSAQNQVFASGFDPILKRSDADGYGYSIDYLTGTGQENYIQNAQTGTSYTLSASSISNGYSVAYSRTPSIEQLSASTETAADISNLYGQIDSVLPAGISGSQIEYKLAEKRLYTETEITEEAAQDSIEQATAAQGVLKSTEILLNENEPLEGVASKVTFSELPASDYFLYAKASGSRIEGYTFQSLWQEAAVEVPPYLLIQFSNSSLNFNSAIPGQFGRQQNQADYTVRNAGNVPAAVDLKKITRNAEDISNLSLVEQFITNDQELILSLVAEKADSKEIVTMGPLIESETLSQPSLALSPFWQTDSLANLYLTGDYSGPLKGQQKISYQFSFAVSAIE